MLNPRVNFRIESGNFDVGFSVSIQCFDQAQTLTLVDRGNLPANPQLLQKYKDWKALYLQWGGASRLDPILNEPTNISFFELVQHAAKALKQEMNQWLDSDLFDPLRQKLYQQLSKTQATGFILQTNNLQTQRLPWSCWTIFEAFPLTQFALAPDSYEAMLLSYPSAPTANINLLAVLTEGEGIDTQGDRQLLEQLPQTQLKIIPSPTRREMTDSLWKQSWDILFFAGHSSSEQGEGKFTIAQKQWMSPSDMKFAIQTAAKQGLKLAIFNSCDGLAIAQDLVKNYVPFIITMREPVPDEVAQTFLAYFLNAFSAGKSLFQSFQEAQKRLESLEDQCPCATWLPALVCNPVVPPPDWHHLLGLSHQSQRKISQRQFPHRWDSLFFISMMILLIFCRSMGLLQGSELWSFDLLMRLRPQEMQDSRILIVELDEASIQNQTERQGSISDQTLNQTIQALVRYQPRVIGLDIYRDDKALDKTLQDTFRTQDLVIGICKSPDAELDQVGVSAPKGLPRSRLGFSDVIEDHDGVVRRQLLFMKPYPTNTCVTDWSFSSALALHYLAKEQIPYHFSDSSAPRNQRLIIGKQIFHSIQKSWGGYQRIDANGSQIMLNYRAIPQLKNIAETIKLDDVLNENIAEASIRDRLVMIGVTANTTTDFWETPYGSTGHDKLPGIFLQAHMVSQLLSAVKDSRPLIHTWPKLFEVLWILVCGLLGFALPQQNRRLRWSLFISLLLGLIVMSFLGLLMGLWVPLIPSLIALTLMSLYQMSNVNSRENSPRINS